MSLISKLTKKAIASSLVKLMERMPFDKITVKDIVDDCDISRNTFYYNYRDIFAVIEELFEAETAELANRSEKSFRWQDALSETCGFLLKYKSAVFSMYGSSRRDFLVGLIRRLIGGLIRSAVAAVPESACLCDRDISIIVSFYTGAVEGFVFRWMDGRMKEDVSILTERCGAVFKNDLETAVRNAASGFSTH